MRTKPILMIETLQDILAAVDDAQQHSNCNDRQYQQLDEVRFQVMDMIDSVIDKMDC